MDDIIYGDGHNSGRFSYEEIMSERERLRAEEGIDERRMCAFLNEKFRGRLCPADGVSMCEDCPGRQKPKDKTEIENSDTDSWW